MSDINYIKNYAKRSLYNYKKVPMYQSLRDRVGVDNLTLSFVRDSLAHTLNFNSWEALLKAPDQRKHFIKLLLSHPYIYTDGILDKASVPDWNTFQWDEFVYSNMDYFSFPYRYQCISRMADIVTEIIKPTKSINYKADHDKLYFIVGPELLRNFNPCGNIDIGSFVFALMVAGFKMVKHENKVFFNISEKSLKAIRQTQELRKELFDKHADCVLYDHMYPEGVLRVQSMG